MENKNKEIGALWEKTSKAGNKFKSGYIQLENGERLEVVVFTNQYKKPGDNTPDLRVYLSEQKGAVQDKVSTKVVTKESSQAQVAATSQEDSDEIPF
jgi:uncharacterized protein (DUF736 family)